MPPKRPRETCFPTGRIKKIMQQDEVCAWPADRLEFHRLCSAFCECCARLVRRGAGCLRFSGRRRDLRDLCAFGWQEVGKVAKAAPVLISKCLELLINDLVKSASKICKSKNAATVNVNHLREAVAKEKTFDFLQEVRCCMIPSVVSVVAGIRTHCTGVCM